MNNFTFYNPVKIRFGEGQIANLKEVLPRNKKIMLVYGMGSIKSNGIYEQVKNACTDFDLIEFSGIPANPEYSILMEAVDLVKNESVDFILAVGGGSVIDGCKFIAAASVYDGEDPWRLVQMKEKTHKALPMGVVLTLPATGSEMNSGAVISREERGEKLAFGSSQLYPLFSILDPTVVASLPKDQIANGIIDAFVHVMEQYLTYPSGALLNDRFSESILQVLMECGPVLMKAPDNYEAASNMMWAATMALNGLIRSGVPEDWSSHMIGHELTALHGLDHAVSLAIVFPGVMQVMQEDKKEKIIQYADRVLSISKDDSYIIPKAIQQTEEFFITLGVHTHLSDYKIGKESIDRIVTLLSGRKGYDTLGEHGKITPEKLAEILTVRL